MRKLGIFLVALAVGALQATPPALAQSAGRNGISLVRDAEIENTIRTFATPLFEAAGLDPGAVDILLVNSNDINAFVAGGQNIFITTGLIARTESADQLMGVIAHEAGHIAGGHLARLQGEMHDATMQSIIAMLLGAAVTVAGGGAAGQAVISGGTHLATRNLLQYSRSHEASADQAAVNYLDQAGTTSRGMLEFLRMLATREGVPASQQNEYVRTHPITQDRVSFVENHVRQSRYSDAPLPPGYAEMHARIRAKIIGFLHPQEAVFNEYPESDASLAARYARAIAYYRRPDLARAIPLIDGLIAERPDDPYFHELKGQMLFENGRVDEAIAAYRRAVELLPSSPLLRTGLARALLQKQDPQLNSAAIDHLHEALRHDRRLAQTWSLLAVAYGRSGRVDLTALALAEKAYLLGNDEEARQQVARAEKLLPEDSAGRQRARDIKRAIEERR